MNAYDPTQRMGRRKAIRTGVLLALGGLTLRGQQAPSGPTSPQTEIHVHDPSTIILCGDTYWLFSTGKGIKTYFSKDGDAWQRGPAVFATAPAWTTQAVPGFHDYFWAPEIIEINGVFHLYYAVSTFRSQISAIGLATNPTLDAANPAYHWTDFGPVIQSTTGCGYNAIDPSLLCDDNKKLLMTFGSFWKGIMLIELDPATGKRLDPDSPPRPLAHHATIEASYLYHHGDYYYLFVNWGFCCRGVNSTYNIRVGRSANIAGPYRDQKGIAMLDGGGTLLLDSRGNQVGPGQSGVATIKGETWFTYHYYDTLRNGQSMLGKQRLRWSEDGWPLLSG